MTVGQIHGKVSDVLDFSHENVCARIDERDRIAAERGFLESMSMELILRATQ